MNQIYKFSDPTSEFTHFILSSNIDKTLKYLNYLYQNFIKNPEGAKSVNSPLVRYLMQYKRPFKEIIQELVFESEDKEVAELKLAELKAVSYSVAKEDVSVAIPVDELTEDVTEEVVETKVEETVEEKEVEVAPTPKKRGRKKKVV